MLNLELIIACGRKALRALKNIGKLKNEETKTYRYSDKQHFAHGEIYSFDYGNRIIKVIHFAHPSYIYNKGRSKVSPVTREYNFIKNPCKTAFGNLKNI